MADIKKTANKVRAKLKGKQVKLAKGLIHTLVVFTNFTIVEFTYLQKKKLVKRC